jgi:putative SOS response-associated peptidase YedK
MCGRYVLKRADLEALVKQFGLRSLEEFHSRYNIAPTSIVPVLRRSPAHAAELTGLRWGLIPAWSKADAPAKPLVNVRAETLVTRFKGALASRRCVLPATGFFEWETRGARKQPWYFAARDGGPLGLAGIWERWRGAGGVELETCAIVTTAPNRVLGAIHDRMPVLLTPPQCRTWLEATEVEPLLAAAPDEAVVAIRVGSAVGNTRNDGPECITPAADEPPLGPEPQLSLGL